MRRTSGPLTKFVALALAFAGTAQPGLRAAFKDDGWGARPSAMGGAYTAVADDADGILWNPAGSAQLKSDEAGFMHAEPFTGLASVQLGLNSFSYAHPLAGQQGTIGAAWTNLTAAKIYREDALLLSYARPLYPFTLQGEDERPYLYGGLDVKYLRNAFTLDPYTQGDPVFSGGTHKQAATVDLGLLGFWDRFSFGLAGKNVTQPNMGFAATDRVPAELNLGTAYRQNILFFEDATISLDYSVRKGGSGLRLGWENWFFNRRAAFRAGWNNQAMSFGFGYRMAASSALDLGVDYTYQVPIKLADQGSGSHRISMVVRFGRPAAEQQQVFSVEAEEPALPPPPSASAPSALPPPAAEPKAAAHGDVLAQAQADIEALERMIQEHRLEPIRFVSGTPHVATDSLSTLDRVVRLFRKYPGLKMRIEGYTDVEGQSLGRKQLSAERARTVAGYFVARGIEAERLKTKGSDAGASAKGGRSISFAFFQ